MLVMSCLRCVQNVGLGASEGLGEVWPVVEGKGDVKLKLLTWDTVGQPG